MLDALLPIMDELDARLLLAIAEGAEEDSLIASLGNRVLNPEIQPQ
ncbi:MAG: hypothetical protein O3B01_20965 [Planctomycetota bacterium]|nr:hypothetical protein [Planctomycetota bacterium]MDA1141045.1 hypothetical protein [Planctomycetota bacterium]